MSLFAAASRLVFFASLGVVFLNSQAQALDLDWHGQFRAEENVIYGYTNGVSPVVGAAPNAGYSIPNTGDSPATFQDLFLRLTPRVLVNDNVTLHTDIWFGFPDRSFFGSSDRNTRNYYSTSTGNDTLTAHALYAEVATDFGTLRAGRMPLNWGLGVVWNAKDDGTDRLPSNGDGVGLITKFGAFTVNPMIVKYADANANTIGNELATGNNISDSGVADYTLSLLYKNDDEQIDLGILFIRRIAGINANVINPFAITTSGPTGAAPATQGYAYNIWDFYAKKKAGLFTVSAEVPLVSGTVAGNSYSTVSGALKATAQASEHWNFHIDLGSASGQDNGTAGATPTSLNAFYFHPDYRPGLILFNYNRRNIANGVGSVYDDPITDAKFIALGATFTSGKWSHGFQGLYAIADKTADGVAGNVYFNNLDRHYETEAGSPAQDKSLGVEFDYALGYQWDESIRFGVDLGLYAPGKFYDFNNTSVPNAHKSVFATNLNMLVKF